MRPTIAKTLLLAAAAGVLVYGGPAARADVVTLKTGQTVEGKVREADGRITLVTPQAAIVFEKDEIEKIEYGPSPMEVYALRASALSPGDAEGHYQLGLYAGEKGLSAQAQAEFEKAVAADPNHARAREKLGYVRVGEEWLTRREAMERQGYVSYRGRYVKKEEAEALEADAASTQRERETWRTVASLATRIRASRGQERLDAQERLSGVSDPSALPAVIDATQDRDPGVRSGALLALLNYRQDDAAYAALDAALYDEVGDLRYQARVVLNRKQSQAALDYAFQLLAQGDDEMRFAVSEVLGAIGDSRAAPYLIEYLSWTAPRGPAPRQRQGRPAPIIRTYVGGVRAKVAPNAVGYEPIIYGIDIYGNRVIMDDEDRARAEDIRFPEGVTEHVLNHQALAALQAMTGQDFRFDREAWRNWYLANAQRLQGFPAPAGAPIPVPPMEPQPAPTAP